ncbi:S41 family peptidase [Dysgonomonas macrotermitis]|uniref:C-terminal processing protease CtpA/Prc, contains a PDZ domain n=1 Tax=Dysgonomonas macrotermitis TaxID=1346286 RepID=A0A1M4T9S9_9BACT|nr:S41 family peptidase [Dysgonomonas macrotermitis]SHE41221.1 C-terminal processing protease CtpA/Prc, contains a PDZ domain [Dysgonomonas macrotermitis]
MKKIFFSILIATCGLVFSSCSKDGGENMPQTPNAANQRILEIMQANYAWDLPDPLPDERTVTNLYFEGLLSSLDTYTYKDVGGAKVTKRYSSISKIADLAPATTSYDIGFEYAANEYSDGKAYYVVLYVKKGSKAESLGIKRGYLISRVGVGTNADDLTVVTTSNWGTLLPDYINSGQEFTMLIRIPNGQEGPFSMAAEDTAAQSAETRNPLYTSTTLTYGSAKIGYVVMNNFLNASSYVSPLLNQLSSFKSAGINNLVLDLRYNATGGYDYLKPIGSALVKSQDKGTTFAYLTNASKTRTTAYDFVTSANGTSVPNLGDQLDNVYVITGQNTAGPAETLIHALRAYWGSNLKVMGELSKGRNVASSGNVYDNETAANSTWVFQIALGYMADKNLDYSYNTGILLNSEVKEINTTSGTTSLLKALGDPEEYVLSTIIFDLTGTTPGATAGLRSSASDMPTPVKYLGSSIKEAPGTISLESLYK